MKSKVLELSGSGIVESSGENIAQVEYEIRYIERTVDEVGFDSGHGILKADSVVTWHERPNLVLVLSDGQRLGFNVFEIHSDLKSVTIRNNDVLTKSEEK